MTTSTSGERALLAMPGFLRLWLAGGIGNAMRWLEMLVTGIFVYDQTGSAFMVAAVTVARTLPMLLLGALAGVLADAVSRKTLLVGGFVVMTANAAVQAALAMSGALELWHFVACGLVAGVVWASELSVRRRMIGESVAPHRVGQAVALDAVTASATRMLGPLAGGVAFETVGIGGAFAISAAAHVLATILVLPVVHHQETRRLSLARVPAEIAEGLAVVRRRPLILGVIVVTIVMNTFGFCYSALIPPIAIGQYGVSPALVGLLAAAEPIGALIAGFAIATGLYRGDRAQTFVSGALLFLAALVATAFAPWYGLAFALLLVGGLGTAAFGSMQSTLIITEAPSATRSRVMGVVTMCIGTGPLGVLAIGTLSDAIGPARAMLTMALIGVALLLLARNLWPRTPDPLATERRAQDG
jgi:MFS family permease